MSESPGVRKGLTVAGPADIKNFIQAENKKINMKVWRNGECHICTKYTERIGNNEE